MSQAGNINTWHHGCKPVRDGQNWHSRANPLIGRWAQGLTYWIGFLIANKSHGQYLLQ